MAQAPKPISELLRLQAAGVAIAVLRDGDDLAERLGAGITGAVAPSADVQLVEGVGAGRALFGDALEARDLAERARPVLLLFLDEAERRVLDRDHAGDVRHAL